MVLSPPTGQSVFTDRMEAARAQTDAFFELLAPESLYLRPVPERHRLIFYLGHLEAFDWNLLCQGALGLPRFNPQFDKLFEFGIDPEPGRLPGDQPRDWPAAEEVRAYRDRVRRKIDEALFDLPEQRLHVALEHRLMHAETLAYLIHNLPYAAKLPPSREAAASDPAPGNQPPRNQIIGIPPGQATLGLTRGNFGWDNEFPRHTVDVPAFRISKYKVTNGEYLRFVETGAAPPHFWTRQNNEWFYRGMFRQIPLPLDWPVYVTQTEAAAYAAWRGAALPSEEQFHRAAYGIPGDARDGGGPEREYPWGSEPPSSKHGNFDFHHWDPVGVAATPAGDSAFGISQLVGNGWEWTSSRFGPFPGFEPFDFYLGYSQNFFDNEHYVMKGGSPRTAACMLRRSFRNWFRPNYPYVYASFRLAEN